MGAGTRLELTPMMGRAEDERAKGELIALVYDELRRVASRLMRRERLARAWLRSQVREEEE
jgi:hypothetical protein